MLKSKKLGPPPATLPHVRLFCFWLYFLSFFIVPGAILFNWVGTSVGLFIGWLVLWVLRATSQRRFLSRIGALPLARPANPALTQRVEELSRRLGIPSPAIYRIPSSGINLGAFGFRRESSALILTDGISQKLSPDEIGALVTAQLFAIERGEVLLGSWLELMYSLMGWAGGGSRRSGGLSLGLLLRRILAYPLALFAQMILLPKPRAARWDDCVARIHRNPLMYSSALRKVEALHLRLPFSPSFSVRHLFLVQPPGEDAVARLLFRDWDLRERIRDFEAATTRLVESC